MKPAPLAFLASMVAASVPANAMTPCCTAAEVSTLRDLVHIARAASVSQPVSDRLESLARSLASGSYRAWADPNRPEILGYIAATSDGQYWRSLIDEFASTIGSSVATPSRAAAATPRAARSVTTTPENVADVQGELLFVGRDTGQERQDDIRGDFKVRFGVNNYDGGARLLQNWNHEGTPRLPFASSGHDSRGTWTYNWFPAARGNEHPDQAPASVHESTDHPLYAPYRGQTLVIDGGAQAAYDYATGEQLYHSRAVLVAAQRAGWPLYFAVSWQRPDGLPMNRAVLKLNADGSANPVELVIDGKLRRLRGCTIGNLNVVCFD